MMRLRKTVKTDQQLNTTHGNLDNGIRVERCVTICAKSDLT